MTTIHEAWKEAYEKTANKMVADGWQRKPSRAHGDIFVKDGIAMFLVRSELGWPIKWETMKDDGMLA